MKLSWKDSPIEHSRGAALVFVRRIEEQKFLGSLVVEREPSSRHGNVQLVMLDVNPSLMVEQKT